MDNNQLDLAKKNILKRVEEYDDFLVLVSDPDGDAVGSGLAMNEILRQSGKKSHLYSSFDLPEYSYLPGFKDFKIQDISTIGFGQYSTIITLDAGEEYVLLDQSKKDARSFKLPSDIFVINIDHHHTNTLYGDINYVPKNLVSTSIGIYEIFKEKVNLTPSLSTNLLTGIIGDTGCFKNSNTTSKSLRIAADLTSKGAKYREIVKHAFYSFDRKIIQMNIDGLNSLKYDEVRGIKYVYAILTPKKYDLRLFSRPTSFITQEILKSAKNTDFSIRITIIDKERTKVSFRSRNIEVVKIAEYFGGGGHPTAAGATVNLSLEKFLKKLRAFLSKNELNRVESKSE